MKSGFVLLLLVVVVGIGTYLFVSNFGSEIDNAGPSEVSISDSLDIDIEEPTGTKYSIIPQESEFKWAGHRVVGGGHEGFVNVSEGTVYISDDGKVGSGRFVVDMNTLITDNETLLKHLKGEDFFKVEEFPTAEIVINNVSATTTEGEYVVGGALTIIGNTNDITFPIRVSQVDGADGLVAESKFSLDRTRWGIKYGSGSFFSDLGDSAIKDEFDVELRIVMEKS